MGLFSKKRKPEAETAPKLPETVHVALVQAAEPKYSRAYAYAAPPEFDDVQGRYLMDLMMSGEMPEGWAYEIKIFEAKL